MAPVVKSTSRPKWQRIPKDRVFYHRSGAQQGHYVLSFAFGFDKEDEVYQFALAFPYGYSKLQAYLSAVESKATTHLGDSFTREQLGSSIQNRRLELLTIGSKPSQYEKRRVVVIIARVHPGESPASFVCQGLLELLISSHPVASILREHVIFKVVPMLNPDGVFLGNYRSTLMGFDLNRSWHIASSWAHPTLKATMDMLIALDKSKEPQLDFVIDIHAHTSLKGCFIYGNTYEDVYRYERHIVFPKLLSTLADDYIASNTMYNADLNKKGTARRFLCSILSSRVNCYTFEVSIFGYNKKGTDILVPYTEDSYMRCGRNLARTFLEYYRIIGMIPINVGFELREKKRKPNTNHLRSMARRSLTERPKTTRNRVLLHFKDLHINDSESSGDEFNSYLMKFREGIVQPSSPPPTTFTLAPKPSLSIIDFNLITRNGIEEAKRKINTSDR